MADYLAQVTLPYDTGLPTDVAVNSWSFIADSDSDVPDFVTALIAFYHAIDNGVLSALLSTAANACKVKVYNRAHPVPRAPLNVTSFTLTTTAATMAPELCVCLSFQGGTQSGHPQARRRGRVFIGPLASGVVDTTTGLVMAGTVTAIRDAAAALLAAAASDPNWSWAVWSDTNGSSQPVFTGWVDNEFDIQRSRGIRATSRNLF